MDEEAIGKRSSTAGLAGFSLTLFSAIVFVSLFAIKKGIYLGC